MTIVGVGLVQRLPNRYTSEAVLVVVQPQIPQRYIDPSNATAPSDMVNLVTRETLSRSRLLGIIDSFGLYGDERNSLAPEQLIDRIRKDLDVAPLEEIAGRESTGFKISFTSNNPHLAQEVTSRLTSFFIEENIKARGKQVSATSKFLSEQLEEARRKLEEQEKRLRDFKASNLGGLPEQEQSNLGALTDLRIQLQSTSSSLNRAQMQRITMEAELNGISARLRSERTALLGRFTAKHPDVLRKDEEIARVDSLLARLKSGSRDGDRGQGWTMADDPATARIQGQVEAYLTDVENLAKEQRRLQVEISQSQGRLRMTPIREQQMAVLLRDYDLYRQDYADLMNRQFRAQLSANAEERQDGQQFRLVDPPTLPVLPSGPKRVKVSLGSAVAGLAIGLGIALLLSIWDTSYHSERQVRDEYEVPLVVGIPVLRTPAEAARHKWRLIFEWVAGSAVALLVVAIEVYALRKG
jgi:polysaccharide chain length determinant protein (PEP-CTERM system associated)